MEHANFIVKLDDKYPWRSFAHGHLMLYCFGPFVNTKLTSSNCTLDLDEDLDQLDHQLLLGF